MARAVGRSTMRCHERITAKIREEQAGDAGHEHLLTDRVHGVGAGVEVAVGAARGLHSDEPDVQESGDRENGSEPPGDPTSLVRQRQQPRQRETVEHEGEPELEWLEPHRLTEQHAVVDHHAANRNHGERAHRSHHPQQRTMQAAVRQVEYVASAVPRRVPEAGVPSCGRGVDRQHEQTVEITGTGTRPTRVPFADSTAVLG
jgi:hypothetical protein